MMFTQTFSMHYCSMAKKFWRKSIWCLCRQNHLREIWMARFAKATVISEKPTGEMDFPEDIGEKLKPFVANYPMNLIQVTRLPESVRNRLTSDFRLIVEYAACKNKLAKLEELIADRNHVIRHPEEFLDSLSAVAGDSRYTRIKRQLQERAEERKEDITMCLIAEALENRGIQKGIDQGIQQGIQQGFQQGIQSVAKNMFIRNMSEEATAAICEESLEQVHIWFTQWRNETP